MSEALQELVHSGCVVEVSTPLHVVNPLSVSIQSTGKKRLILDLRHVNFHVWKEKFKFEDIRTACNYLPYDQFMFKFDLKSGYHHLDILQEHQTFLGFFWVINAIRKYFVFTVLPFGLSSAPYIFSKVVRVLIKYWRSYADRFTVYLDDGLGSAQVFDRCSAASVLVKSTLKFSGFLVNESKCIWQPTSVLIWLGYHIDLSNHIISIPSERISNAKQVIDSIISRYPSSSPRVMAHFVGKIISMGFILGNITRIMTRYSSFDIVSGSSWDSKISMSVSSLRELQFWKNNMPTLNSKRFLSANVHYSRVCYSDASSTGCASYILDFGNTICHKMWSVEQVQRSASHRKLKAIALGLEYFFPFMTGQTINCFTDNQGVSRIVEVGSMKEELQCLALHIFKMCLLRNIRLEVEWIPRPANERADFLSRVIDHDDWRVKSDAFLIVQERWSPHSVDRFANHENSQLPRFNSRFWCPGTETVDAFSVSWAGENNWLVPPIFLIPRVLNHIFVHGGKGTLIVPSWPSALFSPMIFTEDGLSGIFSDSFEIREGADAFVLGNYKHGGKGTFVVPSWPSAPFWPMIFTEDGLSGIFSDSFEIREGTDAFVLGNYKHALFGSKDFRSPVLFFKIFSLASVITRFYPGTSLDALRPLGLFVCVFPYNGMHVDPFFLSNTASQLLSCIHESFALSPLGPCICSNVSFPLLSFFLPFSLSDVRRSACGTLGGEPCEKFWLSAFNSRADNTVINYCNLFRKLKAWCLHRDRGLSFLPATPMTDSSYLHTLLETSLSSSSVHNAFYNLAGYDSSNPCNTFLAKSIAEASSRISRKPVRKAEPITPEIRSSLCK